MNLRLMCAIVCVCERENNNSKKNYYIGKTFNKRIGNFIIRQRIMQFYFVLFFPKANLILTRNNSKEAWFS